MTGLEYVLLHVQEPILYVIRKQHRHSQTQTTPLADYYIIAGVVYQAPDLASVLNSRLLSAVHHLQSSFDEASGFSRYHPSKGYTWDFKSQQRQSAATDKGTTTGSGKRDETKPREEPSSLFQRQRVDMLLGEMVKKFPLPSPIVQPQPKTTQSVVTTGNTTNTVSVPATTTAPSTTVSSTTAINATPVTTTATTIQEPQDNGQISMNDKDKTEIKQEKNLKPPEKKPRLN